MILRVHALWKRSRAILVTTVLSACAVVGLTIVSNILVPQTEVSLEV